MFYLERDKLFEEDSFSLYRDLDLFSKAENFNKLIENNIGDDDIRICDIIENKDVFVDFLKHIEQGLSILNDNVDYTFDFVRYSDNSTPKPCLIIHYPKLKVTMIDRPDISHEMENLYVVIPILYNNNKYVFSGRIYSFKETFSEIETVWDFIHPHVKFYRKHSIVNEFCTGTSDLPDIIFNIADSDNYRKEDFEMFFLLLDSMFRTESTEGRPYKSIDSLTFVSGTNIAPTFYFRDFFDIIFAEKEPFKIFYDCYINNITVEKDLTVRIIDEELFNQGMKEIFVKRMPKFLYVKTGDNLVYYYPGNTNISIKNTPFKYKGELHNIDFKIPTENVVDFSQYSIQPLILTNLKKCFSDIILKKIFRIYGIGY